MNSRAAIDWLQSHPAPSLILLDLMMPEMDGFEFLNRIRDDDKLVDVPVVVLSAKELTAEERISRRTHAARAQQGASRSAASARRCRHRQQRVQHTPAAEQPTAVRDSLMPKILLVEDNEMNRDMLSRRLVRNGIEVVVAVDSGQAP